MQNYIFAHLSPQFYYKSIPCTYKEKHHKKHFSISAALNALAEDTDTWADFFLPARQNCP